jgi:hypothetical protein
MYLANVFPARKREGTKVIKTVARVGFAVLFERDRALKKKTEIELVLGIQEISPIGTDPVEEGVLRHDNKAIAVRKRYTAVAVPRCRLGEQ